MPQAGESPPTRDPGPRQVVGGRQEPLSHEILKLQNELEVYIQKVEELAKRGNNIIAKLVKSCHSFGSHQNLYALCVSITCNILCVLNNR